MIDLVLNVSKYLIILILVFFTIISFRTMSDIPEALKKGKYNAQIVLIVLMHIISYFVIFLNVWTNKTTNLTSVQVLTVFAFQFIYILVIGLILPKIIRLNQGINNIMCMMLTIGSVIQTRLSYDSSLRQFYITLAGTVVYIIFVVFCRKMHFLKKLTWVYCFVGLGMLALVLALSTISHGAKLSLDIGSYFSFQPLEFVKIIFVLFIAGSYYRSSSFKSVLITAIFAAIHILIQVFCKDLGSSLILFVIYVCMTYIATKKLRYVVVGTVLFAGAAYAAYKLFSHVQVRVSAWIDPWSDIEGNGWQIAQSLFAIGTGGWLGSGLFNGNPSSIPYVSKDMVFSAIAEEFGTIFAIFLILLCLCLILMIIRVAIRVNLLFYKLTAFGLAICYAFQVFLTIGGGIKFIPLTGVTLPFISLGGSSIVASMILIGIVQSLYVISEKDVRKEIQMIAQGNDNMFSDDYGEEDDYYNDDSLNDHASDETEDFYENRHSGIYQNEVDDESDIYNDEADDYYNIGDVYYDNADSYHDNDDEPLNNDFFDRQD